ncbi:Barstar (barnase inhibitor) [Anaerococcus octavius]|uniref:Barstar (Barnase inhibitor) n=1 Tax=Anaerococcus octavius TaxID=54007 RepID=A0A380WS45_9FIRM|nr:barstar family protein [Anaerococcus octavius]SUU91847.1 Barstar (barnase inhibitor) [Anaerococcus octavius]
MIILNGKDFSDKEKFYKILNENIDFYYYVENLDALYDFLVTTDYEIKIINYRYIFLNLGKYGQRLMTVFIDAVKDYDANISLEHGYDL